MPSACPTCHYGHRAPFGLAPNPPLLFRCAPLSPRRLAGGPDVFNSGTKWWWWGGTGGRMDEAGEEGFYIMTD